MSGAPQQLTLVTAKDVAARSRLATKQTAAASAPSFKQQDAVIICEDNLAFMRSLPDATMKLIVTSPSYNLGKEYETKSSLDVYLDEQRETIIEAVLRCGPRSWRTKTDLAPQEAAG